MHKRCLQETNTKAYLQSIYGKITLVLKCLLALLKILLKVSQSDYISCKPKILARDKHSSLFRRSIEDGGKKVLQLQQQEAQRILVPHKPNHLRYLAALRATRGSNSDPADDGKVSITPSYSLHQLDTYSLVPCQQWSWPN